MGISRIFSQFDRATVLVLVGVAALALALRLAWTFSLPTDVREYSDPQWYFVTARNLADGHGLTIGHSIDGPPTYVAGPGGSEAVRWPQGYSLTLGAIFAIFGVSLTAAKMLNVVAGVATVVLTFFFAYRLFGPRVAIVSSLIMAIYPAHVIWTSVVYSDVLFTVPLLAAMTLTIWTGRRPTLGAAAAIGAAVGYAALIRPQGMVVLVAVCLFWAMHASQKRDALRVLSIAVLAASIFVVPNVVWNSIRTGQPMLLSQNMGFNLRIGHAPYSKGEYISPSDLWTPGVVEIQPGAYPDEGIATRRAIKYAATHPMREVELSFRKAYFLLIDTDSDALYWASNFSDNPPWGSERAMYRLGSVADYTWYAILLLAVASLPVTFSRKGEIGFAWTVLLMWVFVHIVFFGEPRYRLPIMPIFVTFAAVSICELFNAVRELSRERLPELESSDSAE